MRDIQQSAQTQPSKTKSRAQLVVIDPAASTYTTGATIKLTAKTSVGRHPDCTLSIEEPFLSAFHAELEARNGAWYLTDLDSTNGTFVNGRPVTGTTYIEDDDVVQFGRMKLQFVV